MCIETIINHLHNWQSLTAGLLAFVGAIVTTWVLILNLRHEKKKHTEAQKRDAMYTKSLLADALVELHDYCKNCYLHIVRNQPLPDKPSESISILRQNIKCADNVTAKNLTAINSFYQVQHSRIKEYPNNNARHKLCDALYDMSKLSFYFLRLFDYAREEEEIVNDISINQDQLAKGLRSLIDDVANAYGQGGECERFVDLILERHGHRHTVIND